MDEAMLPIALGLQIQSAHHRPGQRRHTDTPRDGTPPRTEPRRRAGPRAACRRRESRGLRMCSRCGMRASRHRWRADLPHVHAADPEGHGRQQDRQREENQATQVHADVEAVELLLRRCEGGVARAAWRSRRGRERARERERAESGWRTGWSVRVTRPGKPGMPISGRLPPSVEARCSSSVA